MERAHRHVDRRDGRLEGQPDVEPDAPDAMKDAQRDLTSLSGPVRRRPKPKGQDGRV